MVLGAWRLVVGVWWLVLGAWLLALGAWLLALGAWCLVFGAWCLAIGVWCFGALVLWCFGAWCLLDDADEDWCPSRFGALEMLRCQILKFGSQSDHLCSSNYNKGHLAALLAFRIPKLVLTLQASSCPASPCSLTVLRPCFFASSARSFAASLMLCFFAGFVLVRSFFL